MRWAFVFVVVASICFLSATPAKHRLVLLAVQEGTGTLQIVSLEHPGQARPVQVGDKPHEIELARDGRTAYVSNFGLLEANHKVGIPGNSISVVDVVRAQEIRRLLLPSQCLAPHGLKLRPPKYQELFVNTEEGQQALVVFDVHTSQVLRRLPIPISVHNFAFDRSGSRLYAFALDGNVYSIDPDRGIVLAQSNVGSVRGLTWTSDGRQLIASAKGELVLLNADTLVITRRISGLQVGQIFYPAALADGKTVLAPAAVDGVLLVVNLQLGTVEKRIRTGAPLQLCLGPSGARVWITNVAAIPPNSIGGQRGGGGITELDLRNYTTREIGGFPNVNGIAVADIPE